MDFSKCFEILQDRVQSNDRLVSASDEKSKLKLESTEEEFTNILKNCSILNLIIMFMKLQEERVDVSILYLILHIYL